MNRKGVNYDVGTQFGDGLSRPLFDLDMVRRELEIIKQDLRCSAIRISGLHSERLIASAAIAHELGLEVWLSPLLHDRSPAETLAHMRECASKAEILRRTSPSLVFVLGCECTLFMQGLLPGDSFHERIGSPGFSESLHSGRHNEPLNAYLREALSAVRSVFGGAVTYASTSFEDVDWTAFDYIGVNHYRMAHDRISYGRQLSRYRQFNKPLIVTEFGCCTYRGAENVGSMGWAIIENAEGIVRLNGDYVRDEALQAREITDMFTELDAAGVDGAFVYTFVSPLLVHVDAPRLDFDLASYSLVKTYFDHNGVTYPGMPWEPKAAFHAVAQFESSREPAATGVLLQHANGDSQ